MASIVYPLDSGKEHQHIVERESGYSWARFVREWVVTVDHKQLGMMYIVIALLFFVVAGLQGR